MSLICNALYTHKGKILILKHHGEDVCTIFPLSRQPTQEEAFDYKRMVDTQPMLFTNFVASEHLAQYDDLVIIPL